MPIDLARRLTMEGLLSDEEFAAVVARRAAYGEPVPVALEGLRIVRSDSVAGMFDRMGFAPAQKLAPASVVRALPPGMLRLLWALPIGETPTGFVVAMVDPTDRHALAELAYHLRKPVDPRWAPVEALRKALRQADPVHPGGEPKTRPAAAPPPAGETDDDPVMRIPPAAMAEEVMTLMRPGPRRPATPAYGQARPVIAREAGAGWGKGGADAVKQLVGQPLATSPGGIGAFRGTHDGAPPLLGGETPLAPPPTGTRDSEAPIPLRRKPRAPSGPRLPAVLPASREALYALAELRAAPDRDAVAKITAVGMTTAAHRAAFFVVKRGVVQGWEGATLETSPGAGMSREALRNLWIPVTTPSIFRVVSERSGLYLGPMSDSTADSILAAALGGRPGTVLLAPVSVRGKVVGFLYADGLAEGKTAALRAEELISGAAEALERVLSRKRER